LLTFRLAVTLVAAAGLLAGVQPVQRWQLVRDLRVGAADGPRPYTFSPQALVAAREDGTLYVLDSGNHEVRVFDARGRHMRTFGREGAGPGEFMDADGAGWLGDTMWVSDPMQMRTTFFTPSGNVLRTAGPATRASERYAPTVADAVLADGSSLVLARPLQPRSPTERPTVSRLPVLRVGRSGSPDTLAWRDLRHRQVRVDNGGRTLVLTQPWDDSPLVSVSKTGRSVVLISRPAAARAADARFHVMRLSPFGDTLFSRSFPYTPVAVPAGWASRWADETAGLIAPRRAGTDRRALETDLVRGVYVPAFKPPVTAVVAGDDGTVWLRREQPEEQGGTVVWNVLSGEGQLLAEVRAPGDLEIQQVQRSHVWGVMADDLDVPYVYRFRIQRPSR
jgi:hypothetical protein